MTGLSLSCSIGLGTEVDEYTALAYPLWRTVENIMISGLLQLILALAFVALACLLTYKITVPICLKIFDLGLRSTIFRKGICITLALFFGAVGILMLKDFIEETEHGLTRYFPLLFLTSGFFLFLLFWKPKK